ncbi:MAG: nucleotide pyrophosphohydrolase [Spirochaetes bacterium]|nr:MAG: nucleotide pyrophosphohydrolase [Spirochaetota bacterium]
MDEKDSLTALRGAALAFRDERDWRRFHTPKNLATGLSIEAAELQELFLWKTEDEARAFIAAPEGKARASQEIADVFVFLLYLAEECGIDLADAVRAKIALNGEKYPVEKSFGSAAKYTEFK